MKQETQIIKEGENLVSFKDGLKMKTNQAMTEDCLITLEPMNADRWLSIQELKTVRMWCNEWANQRGTSADACYCEFKVKFLWPQIKVKRNMNIGSAKEIMTLIWKQVTPDIRYQAVGQHIRSSWANHEDYHKALTDFYKWATTEASLQLTEPDKYRAARQRAIETGKIQKV